MRCLTWAFLFSTACAFAASTEADLRSEFLQVRRNEVVHFARFSCLQHLLGHGEDISGFLMGDIKTSFWGYDYVWIQTNQRTRKIKLSQIVPSSFFKTTLHHPRMDEVHTLLYIALHTAMIMSDDVFFRTNTADRNRWNEGGKVYRMRSNVEGTDYIIELSDDPEDADSDTESVLLSEIDPSSFEVNLPLRHIFWRALRRR